MENYPLVSLLIITMNHQDYIKQACESAMAQTYPNLEIILLDNISQDNTLEIAEKTLSKSKFPVTILRNSNAYGIAKNLNILVREAKGDYCCILSGDDWFSEDNISEKIIFFNNRPEVDFLLTDGYRYLQAEKKLVDAYSHSSKQRLIKSMPHFFHENVTQNLPINVGVMVKSNLLHQHPFDEKIHTEDWDMNLRLTSLGYTIGFLDKKLFYYRILNKSLSSNWVLMEKSYKQVTDKYLDYINKDQSLVVKYKVNLLKHHFEKQLSQTDDEKERKAIQQQWKIEKAKIKYPQPFLFFKLLWLKIK